MPVTSRKTPRLAISNLSARQLWLQANLLSNPATGRPDIVGLIRQLGFLQIDTVRNITRAQDHILWSRNQNYREPMLWPHLRNRALFEHFTHDASLIPMDLYPMWQRQFQRLGQKAANAGWYRSGLTHEGIRDIRNRIRAEGALSTHAFESAPRGGEMWARPPHKKALEQMWYAGELATSHRENFVKFYDLAERVFPPLDDAGPTLEEQADHLCRAAIDRLWIANAGEIRRFWDAVTVREVAAWLESQGYKPGKQAKGSLVPVTVEDAKGHWHDSWAVGDIETRLAEGFAGTRRMRIINPFDPAIRDRRRLQRLFGFEYRNEMFVPQADRRWGYYVYPLLEGDRFVGRVELKGNRQAGWMRVTGFWPETGIRWGAGRIDRLRAELARFARLAGLAPEQFDPARYNQQGRQLVSP